MTFKKKCELLEDLFIIPLLLGLEKKNMSAGFLHAIKIFNVLLLECCVFTCY